MLLQLPKLGTVNSYNNKNKYLERGRVFEVMTKIITRGLEGCYRSAMEIEGQTHSSLHKTVLLGFVSKFHFLSVPAPKFPPSVLISKSPTASVFPSLWIVELCIYFHNVSYLEREGGDCLAVNISGQHVCVLRVRVPLLPPCGYSGV
jgi:hypothetical protein